ncbi:MAG: type II secretion system F family protein [Bifidobacteriaceae bacterium]|jgi:type IV pilus assembly protein PilC|nr:type II secretion system F family protein [Bifidobacteriaceae bacterium]
MATAGTKTFEYTVIAGGSTRNGKIDGPDQQTVARHLRENGLTPIAIDEVSKSGLNMEIKIGGNRARPKDVAVAMRQLATMVNAGLSLFNSLNAIIDQAGSSALAVVLREVAGDVETGSSLGEAMSKHPRTFSPVIIAMIKAGEAGGFLDTVLLSVADQMEAELRLRRAVISAMVYPVVVLCFAGVIVVIMLLFIVPVFEGIFDSVDKTLPLPTLVLVKLSAFLRIAGIPLLVALILAIWWWNRHKNDLSVRQKVDPIKLKTPIVGGLMLKVALARLSRSIATMSSVGVPIVQTLEIVADTAGNVVVTEAVERVKAQVMSGVSMGKAIAAEPIFGPMISHMVAVGEEAGALDQMLDKVAQFYDEEVTAATASITSIIEPVLIAFVGVIVGSILISLYLPIFQLTTGATLE